MTDQHQHLTLAVAQAIQPLDVVVPERPFPPGVVSHLLLVVAMVAIAPALWRHAPVAPRVTEPAFS